MMRAYIERFHDPSKIEYLHPVMEQQLKETYGVMVYQEDVLKVGHHFGGLDLADADVLRRMMSGKGRNKKHLLEIEDKYYSNCRQFGYPEAVAIEVWRQIESFAGYSFSKAHSASFAVESFQSLYLKTYYPIEFMTAVINNFGGFYSTRVYVNEARKAGATINLPCVNHSNHYTLLLGTDLYLGFIHIKDLESSFAQLIPLERKQNGLYTSLENFVLRTQVTLEQLIILIRIGSLRFTGKSKKTLLWEAHVLLNKSVPESPKLFSSPVKSYTLPVFETAAIEDAYDEIELLGFPVTTSMFDLLRTDFRGEIKAKDLINHVGKYVRMVGNYITAKHVRTVRNETMNFGTFLDADGNFFDTTHFPPSLRAYPFKGAGVYLVLGKVVEEFGFPSIEVEKMAKLPVKADPRS
jgi:DNA polymerase-3 subunit alpha